MKAIILAAGYATRLYPLTKDRAKALLPVGGKPIIDYIVDELETLDEVDLIAVVSNELFFEQFEIWAKEKNKDTKKEIVVVNDQTDSEETKLGAIKDMQYVIDKLEIDEDIVVVAGDNLFTYQLKDSYDVFKKEGKDMVLAKSLSDISQLKRMAVGVLDENGIIVDLEEKPKNPKSDIAFFATYFYTKESVKMIQEYLDEGNSPDAPGNFPAWLYTKKPVMAHLFEGECYDIGTHESYEEVKEIFGE